MKYRDFIDEFTYEQLDKNEKVSLINIKTYPKSRKKLQPFSDNSMISFFTELGGFNLKWESKLNQDTGSVKILKTDEIFISYKNFVYFDHTPEDSPLRDFKIIDFFVDEACVGIYDGREDLPGMHFFEFENEAYPLHVDFEGYLKLLGETKGYLYWQKVILDHLRNEETPITKEFKENMPKLFEDFEFDKFIELYESLRIDK